jgi:hypothetical protein
MESVAPESRFTLERQSRVEPCSADISVLDPDWKRQSLIDHLTA